MKVDTAMLAVWQELQILEAIVCLVAIDMVDVETAWNPPMRRFPDRPMQSDFP